MESILTLEPHYYVLGSKSFGLAHDRFPLKAGHQQIRQAFAIIGGPREPRSIRKYPAVSVAPLAAVCPGVMMSGTIFCPLIFCPILTKN